MCQPLRCRGRTQQRLNKVHWFLACGCVLNTKPSKTQSTGWPVKRHGDLQMSITVPSTRILLPFMPITLTGRGPHCPICLPHSFFWFQNKNQKPKTKTILATRLQGTVTHWKKPVWAKNSTHGLHVIHATDFDSSCRMLYSFLRGIIIEALGIKNQEILDDKMACIHGAHAEYQIQCRCWPTGDLANSQ